MLDLDNFKSINDDFGHNVGDHVLKSVSDYMKEYFRSSDMIFRIGGEEFLVLLYNTDETDSLVIAEKVRADIEQLPLITDRPVTVSVGVSSLKPGMNWKTWMKQCDKKMYLAKSGGRNQVVN
jgi:diguanylate cyclase (GGDEF)-like protein